MALSKVQKQAQVSELTDKMSRASSVMLAHYIGLSVAQVSELRQKLREQDAEMKVAKKMLMKIAAKDAALPELPEDQLEGPVSLIFSFGDPLSGAQVAFTFSKGHDQVELLGGIFEGKVFTKEEAVAFAQIPGREVLLATFASMLCSPLVNFAGMCGSPLSGLARAVQQMAARGGFVKEDREKKEEREDAKDETAETEVEEATDEEKKSDAPEADSTPAES